MTEFWKSKLLTEMSIEEWESLCDCCGRCCLIKLEDVDSGELHFTNIACRQLDQVSCQCRHYQSRTALVPDCLELTAESLPLLLDHLPASCAYRRLARGLDLPEWHPLQTGNTAKMQEAGIPVSGKVVGEEYIHPEQYEDHIIEWHDGTPDGDINNK